MDIHPPEGPTHSFGDFLIHIGVVTIGILIALGLESIEEHVHYQHVVQDARENFRAELTGDRGNLKPELRNDAETLATLNGIIASLPALRAHPPELARQIFSLTPSGYFLSSSRWDAAISSGALTHMSVEEVNHYGDATFLIRTYAQLETRSSQDWTSLESFFRAHTNPSPADIDNGVEKLYVYQQDVRGLDQVGKELSGSLDVALKGR